MQTGGVGVGVLVLYLILVAASSDLYRKNMKRFEVQLKTLFVVALYPLLEASPKIIFDFS